MTAHRTLRLLPLLSLALAASCHDGGSGGGTAAAPALALGDPMPDLTPEELAAFERGKVIFMKDFKPSEGLGPLYNATSCRSCHSTPAPGGAAPSYRNFYLFASGNPITGEQRHHVDLPSIVVPAFGTGRHATADFALNGGRFVIPEEGTYLEPFVVAMRNSIPIFGVGMFEFVSDTTILSHADPEDLDGDGIHGRFNKDASGVGRFGVKCRSNNLEAFTRGPLQNQMGITTDPLPGDDAVSMGHLAFLQAGSGPNDPTTDADSVPDPEMTQQDLEDLIAFSRFLAPPQPQPFDDAARHGQALFEQVGCAKCHIPSLPSSRGPVNAYTDLLIHEMGNELRDGIAQGKPQIASTSSSTTFREFRTAPLWGVSHVGPWLHDGRAQTLEQAILAHAGEARSAVNGFTALTPDEQADVIRFLEHL